MKSYWSSLGSRERLMLQAGAVFLVLLLPYWLIWQPLAERADRLERSVAQQAADLAWMRDVAERLRGTPLPAGEGPGAGGGQSLLSLIDSTVREGALAGTVRRVQPEGANAVRVWLDAPFDDLILWLDGLHARHGVRVTSLVVDRQPLQGRVHARLSLEQ